MDAVDVVGSRISLQALFGGTDALAEAAAWTDDGLHEASAENIAQHMQEILRQHVLLQASGGH